MKRWLALLLVLVLCLALAACGDDKKKSDDDDEDEDEGEGTTVTTTVEGGGEHWSDLVNPGGTQTRTLPNDSVNTTAPVRTDIPVTDRTEATTTTTYAYDEPVQATTTTRTPATVTTRNPMADTGSSVAAYVAQYKSEVEAMSNDQMMMSLQARGTSVVYLYAYTTIYDATPEMKEVMIQSMESQASTLASALAGMKTECPAITSLIYEYYTADGDLILSYEYK